MKYMKNPITRFCFKYLQRIACEQPSLYYKKRMLANLNEMKHQLSVLDRGINTERTNKSVSSKKAEESDKVLLEYRERYITDPVTGITFDVSFSQNV